MMFKDLKPGDTVLRNTSAVLVRDNGWNPNHLTTRITKAHTVERVTATQATTNDGIRFRLADGVIIGSAESSRSCVYPVGYVNPHARDALESQPMAPTSDERVSQVLEVQRAIKTLQNAIQAFSDHQPRSLRNTLAVNGWGGAIGLMTAATDALQAITLLPEDNGQ